MSYSDNPQAKPPRLKSKGTVRKKPRPGTAFEKALMNGFAERLQKRASRSATYMEVKNEYGSAIRVALDAGVGMDEFVAIYSERKKQVTGEPLSPDQESHIKSSFKLLRADWARGKLKSRKVSSNDRTADKTNGTIPGKVIVGASGRHEDLSSNTSIDLAADNRRNANEPRVGINDGTASRPYATPSVGLLTAEAGHPEIDASTSINVRPSSFDEKP